MDLTKYYITTQKVATAYGCSQSTAWGYLRENKAIVDTKKEGVKRVWRRSDVEKVFANFKPGTKRKKQKTVNPTHKKVIAVQMTEPLAEHTTEVTPRVAVAFAMIPASQLRATLEAFTGAQ